MVMATEHHPVFSHVTSLFAEVKFGSRHYEEGKFRKSWFRQSCLHYAW